MNRFTLKFNDENIEQQFQRSKALIKQKAMERYLPTVCVITLIILINSLVRQFLSITILSSIFLIIQLIGYYMIVRKGFGSQLQPLVMGIILGMTVTLQIVAILDCTIPHSEVDWIQDISLLLSINYVLSTDISWNLLFFLSNLVIRLYFRFTNENFNFLSIAFVLCSLISFYNEYDRIVNMRLEFQLKEENQSSQNIFDTFQKKSIIILKYDDQTMKYDLKFQNICSIHYFQEFRSQFLKIMAIGKSNLGKYIFKSIQANDYSTNKLTGKYEQTYYNVTYQVTKSTDIQILIVITKKPKQKLQLIKSILYKSLLMKVKKLDQKLYHQEILKNMMYNIMKHKKNIGQLILQEIQPQHLQQFFRARFNKAKIYCQVDNSIKTNLLMIDCLILLISKNLKVLECTIIKSPSNLINITLKGVILKRQMSPARKELFQLILLRIGTGIFTIDGSTLTFEVVNFTDLVPYK